MATTAINVNKQTVVELLSSGARMPFVIPEYQRPYAWGDEQVTTLFEDLWEFTMTTGGSERDGTYFLGCIVSFENNKEQEIIDGQQRITTLFLLLRAIYTSLENSVQTDYVKNFKDEIGRVIWRRERLSGNLDRKSLLIESRVISNDGNRILRNILETGITDDGATDNYSLSYRLLQRLFSNYSEKYPLQIFDFIYAVLNQAILLPITADSQDTALVIFNTLNARGLPLADADIFKAKIYNRLNEEEKKDFVERWAALEESARNSNESIQSLFYYYMFYLRAVGGDKNSSTPGIRKFYSERNFERLYEPELIDNLNNILTLWKLVYYGTNIKGETWVNNKYIRKSLDILTSYPNEFWKYPVLTFYLSHRWEVGFECNFLLFINRLLSELVMRFCLSPTLNAVKGDIMKLSVDIVGTMRPVFSFREIETHELQQKIKVPYRSSIRMLLKILAYERQDDLINNGWEIEHIFPKKWKSEYTTQVSDEFVKERIEHLGNLLPFEQKLNIIASNQYLGKKKPLYAESKIRITREFGEIAQEDWTLDNIIERDVKVSETIIGKIKKWRIEYDQSFVNN